MYQSPILSDQVLLDIPLVVAMFNSEFTYLMTVDVA